MTLDEAIKHCLEVAEQNEQGLYDAIALGGQNPTQEEIANCEQCAADHRQLAEWLTELKELRNSIGAVKLKDMKEAVGLLQELNTENDQLTSQLADAKRLLKLAVEDFDMGMTTDDMCEVCKFAFGHCTGKKCTWRYADKALELLNDEK